MPESFLTLRSSGEHYAVPSEEVSEVIRFPTLARLPQAPAGLLGLANLRGTVLPVASLRGLLGVSESASGEAADRRAIVLDHSAPVALAVDAVEGLMTVETNQIENGPELSTRPGERLKGIFAARSRSGESSAIKILDVPALIDAAFVQRARHQRGLTVAHAETTTIQREIDDRQRLVSFEVAGQEYAFPLDVVQEVLDAPDILAALPASEDLVLGVAAHRDSLLPLLSLRCLLGFAKGEGTGGEKVIVTRVSGAVIGLLADRVLRIFPADADLIENVPALLRARAGGEARISAIYRGERGRRPISILSPDQLFREDVMQRLNASTIASTPSEPRGERPVDERQFVVFRLSDDEFGLPIEAVEEVALVPDQITRLPRTPKFLEGVVNLRGDVLPVVDQRRRFDMPPPDRQQARRLMVVRTERHRAGLIVDGVSEVIRCPGSSISPAPSLTNERTRLVHGVLNLEKSGRIIMLLDPAELLTRAERGLLDAFQAKNQRLSR
jgi:purine-binding chemotaxis protein CheW